MLNLISISQHPDVCINHFLSFSLSFINLSHLMMMDTLGVPSVQNICFVTDETTDAGCLGGGADLTVRSKMIRLAETIFWFWNHVRVPIPFALIPTHEVLQIFVSPLFLVADLNYTFLLS